MAKVNVYCLTGLGADERLFDNIALEYGNIQHIPYLVPKKKESFTSYSQRMLESTNINPPYIFLGCSFGGLTAIEMAKQSKPEKVIIVSSLRHSNETPRHIRIFRTMQLHKVVHVDLIKSFRRYIRPVMGDLSREENELFNDMLMQTDNRFWRWAAHRALFWKHDEHLDNLVQIHGDNDKLFPVNRIKEPDYMINGGTHYMLQRKGDEISQIIDKELNELLSGLS